MQGAPPLHPTSRKRHGLNLRRRPSGACLFGCLLPPAFSFVLAPIPGDPRSQSALPRREGGIVFLSRGPPLASPLNPGGIT